MRTRFICLALGVVLLSPCASGQWVQTNGPWVGYVKCFAVSGTNLFAGTDAGVFLSTNSGTSWSAASTGLTNFAVSSFAVSGTDLFAGTIGGSVDRRQLSELVTSVGEVAGDLPGTFNLGQNYPNPLNPKTGIRFQVPGASNVRLVVYDLPGREVAVLVDEKKAAGSYEVAFDGSGHAIGVYIYRMTAESFVQTRKMILVNKEARVMGEGQNWRMELWEHFE